MGLDVSDSGSWLDRDRCRASGACREAVTIVPAVVYRLRSSPYKDLIRYYKGTK